MAKRYAAFNTLAGCIRSTTGVVDGNTTAGNFDSTYVASAISLPTGTSNYAAVKAPFAEGSTSIASFCSIRFDYNGSFTNGGIGCVRLYSGGVLQYQIIASSGSSQVQYWNGTAFVNWGATFTFPTGRQVFTWNITPGTSFELFINGLSIATGTTPSGAAASFDEVRWLAASASGGASLSQVMMGDYDLRDAHIFSKLASGEGTYGTDGTGVYTDVNETVLNDGTAIQLPTTGQHRTFTKAAITVPVGLAIAGMMVNARARIGGSVPDAKLMCKQGANDSKSPSKGYATAYDVKSAFFDLDPATSSPFTQSGYNSAEFGFEAA